MTAVWIVVFALLFLLVAGNTARRMRRNGPGLRVGYIPPRLRPAFNRLAARRGWPRAFDDEGHKIRPAGR